MKDSINLFSTTRTNLHEEDDSPIKDYLTKEPEHYFQAFESVQITKNLVYIGPIDKNTLKFNGLGRIMTSKGEMIYEGKSYFYMIH
jgi:hypothetical protein